MALLAHSTTAYRELGRLVADVRSVPRRELRARYESKFMATLALTATRRRQTNVLMHMAGHLKRVLDERSKIELLQAIDVYRRDQAPLTVPLTLLRRHARAHTIEYLLGQTYLQPHPSEAMLRDRA